MTSRGEAVAGLIARWRKEAENFDGDQQECNVANRCADELETILADLDRLQRPPALGELSDTVLFNLYAEMNAVYVLSRKIPSAAEVAKAAREFLGKVDG